MDWYRKTTWTESDASDFEARLARSRSQRNQYLKVQAWTLVQTEDPALAGHALRLAEQCLKEEPEGYFAVEAHLVCADAKVLLGDRKGALVSFREAARKERVLRGTRVRAYLMLAEFIVKEESFELYEEALVEMEQVEDADLVFPLHRFQYFGTQALLLKHVGKAEEAKSAAQKALDAVGEPAPFQRHPEVGLVADADEAFLVRLREVIASNPSAGPATGTSMRSSVKKAARSASGALLAVTSALLLMKAIVGVNWTGRGMEDRFLPSIHPQWLIKSAVLASIVLLFASRKGESTFLRGLAWCLVSFVGGVVLVGFLMSHGH